jgi:hypothetical protein
MTTISGWLNRVRGSASRVRKGARSARRLRAAYSQYAAANRNWLCAFRDLAVEIAPRLGAATRLKFSLQLAYLDRRDIRLHHLLDHAPDRLRPNGSLSDFVGAVDQCWSEEDEGLLGRLRPDYRELCAMVASVKAKAEEEVMGFREHLDAVSKTERSLELLNAFQRDVERIEREVWSA